MSLRNVVWLGIFVAIALMFFGLAPLVTQHETLNRTYGPVVELDALIRKRFVEEIDDNRLVDGAIRGMICELDPYSGYISPHEMAAFERSHSSQYIGVGMELGVADGRVRVIAPVEDGPAMRAGVLPGDELVSIDGRLCDGLSIIDVEHLLLGDEGASVTLTVRRRNGNAFTTEIRREVVRQSPVVGFAKRSDGQWDYFVDADRRIAYIRVARFTEGMVQEFDAALRQIVEARSSGLIIDLRNNPGGLLTEAVALVDRFIDTGVIVTTVTRRRAVDTYVATSGAVDSSLRLAVLINGSSASSAEIVAGSLQDHHRSVIVGERSFGKGSVQDFIKLDGGRGAVKLTVAHYQLPGGRIIHRKPGHGDNGDWGVMPEIVVPQIDTHSDGDAQTDHQLQAALEALRDRLGD